MRVKSTCTTASPPNTLIEGTEGIMADVVKLSSGVPRVQLRRADDLVERIVALKCNADERGFRTLSYFLEVARIEAQLQADRIAEEHETGKQKPEQPWLPIQDDV